MRLNRLLLLGTSSSRGLRPRNAALRSSSAWAPLRAAPPTGEGRSLPQTPSPFDELPPLSSTSVSSTQVSTESREGQSVSC